MIILYDNNCLGNQKKKYFFVNCILCKIMDIYLLGALIYQNIINILKYLYLIQINTLFVNYVHINYMLYAYLLYITCIIL